MDPHGKESDLVLIQAKSYRKRGLRCGEQKFEIIGSPDHQLTELARRVAMPLPVQNDHREPEKPLKFGNPEGLAILRNVMRQIVWYNPHDYQPEAVARAIKGQGVLALLPMGAGKTGILV